MRIGIVVLDERDNPINGLITETIFKDSSEKIIYDLERVNRDYHKRWPGSYILIGDHYKKMVKTTGDTLLFVGKLKNEIIFDQKYIVNTDSCRCHVYKIEGPDTIIVNKKIKKWGLF